MSIQDFFSDEQSGNTTLSVGSWTPTGDRFISQFGAVGSGGFTTNMFSALESTDLRYIYTTPQDFSLIDTINLSIITAGGAISVVLSMTDSNNNTADGSVNNITGSGVVSWSGSEFTGIDKTQIAAIQFTFVNLINNLSTLTANALYSFFVCLAEGTKILMANGVEKSIEKVRRGDLVRGDPEGSIIHRVARLMIHPVADEEFIDIVRIEPGSFGEDIPHTSTLISGNHPILHQNIRRPAKAFRYSKGVTYCSKEDKILRARDILPKKENEQFYRVYDLQFDHDGTYVANGLVVQSRSPYSDLTPLPRKLYFEPEKYWRNGTTTWDSLEQNTPLSMKPFIITKR